MTLRNYTFGFLYCLILSAAAFWLVYVHVSSGHQLVSHTLLTTGILGLAVVQLLVQMRFFLHLGKQSKLRDLVALAFAVTIVLLVVCGSLWIMANLGHSQDIPYSGTPSPQTEQD